MPWLHLAGCLQRFFPVKIKSARETGFWPFLPLFSWVETRFHEWIIRFFHGQNFFHGHFSKIFSRIRGLIFHGSKTEKFYGWDLLFTGRILDKY